MKPTKQELFSDCLTLTDKQIAIKYKIADRTVSQWKKIYGISKKAIKNDLIPKELTEIQKDIITGKLLGDGCIEKLRYENTCFSIEHSLAQKDYVMSVNDYLNPFSLPIRYRTRKNPLKKLPHHIDQLHSCLFRTVCCPIFTKLRKQWYPQGVKIVPKDINLTWRAIAIWYCDDGSNLLGQRCVRRHGVLCTNSFTAEDVKWLIEKLKEKEIKSRIYFQSEQPIIHIDRESFMYFLRNIEKYVPWKCFEHKLQRNKT